MSRPIFLQLIGGSCVYEGVGLSWSDMVTSRISDGSKYLAILGLKKPPTLKALKEARNALMKKAHPDAGGSNHAAALINDAYENLLKLISSAGQGR